MAVEIPRWILDDVEICKSRLCLLFAANCPGVSTPRAVSRAIPVGDGTLSSLPFCTLPASGTGPCYVLRGYLDVLLGGEVARASNA